MWEHYLKLLNAWGLEERNKLIRKNIFKGWSHSTVITLDGEQQQIDVVLSRAFREES